MCAFDKRARESMRDRGNIEDNSLHHLLATDCRDFFKSRLNLYTKCLSGNDFKNNACLTEIGALFFNLQRKYRNFYNKAYHLLIEEGEAADHQEAWSSFVETDQTRRLIESTTFIELFR